MNQSTEQEAKQLERERYAYAIRAWYAAFKNVRLYSPDHPTARENASKFVSALQQIFQTRFGFSIDHTDGLFVVDDLFFIEESLSFYDLLHAIETHNLVKVLFLPGITEKEVIDCSAYLLNPDATTSELTLRRGFSSNHINSTVASGEKKKSDTVKARLLWEQSTKVYNEWLQLTDKTLTRLLEEQNVLLAELSLPLDQLIDAISQRPSDFARLLCTRIPQNLHQQHSLHTMIQSIFLGQQIGLDPTSIKVLALAALFHDVGRLLLPSDFSTGYKLAPPDAEMIQLHTRDGASFLAGVQGLPMSVVRAALEHHIGHDGQGYPALPTSQKPHLFSQMIGLADFVSWATVSENYYHKPVSPHRIIRSVIRRSGTQFSPLLVKLLLPFFGIYPPGTIVRLTTGEEAVSMKANLAHIGRPLVVVKDSNKGWAPRSLGVPAGSPPMPFLGSIGTIIGRHQNIEPLIDCLPDLDNPTD